MRVGWRPVVGLCVVAGVLVFGASGALAAFHGVAVAKSTVSPVKIGDPYTSSAFVGNTVDTGHDTMVVTGLTDVVFASGGNQNSGNILSSVGLIFGGTGTVTCVGGSGAGTVQSPYVGATSCTLTFGATITTASFTHYTVQPGDFNINPVTHRLSDQITWDWHNTCVSDPDQDCSTKPQQATAGASAEVLKLNTTTATDIHNAAHGTVTVVEVGTTVHDFVTVTGQPGSPNPTGNVTIDWFTNSQCSGAPAATSAPVALTANGTVDATAFPQGPLAAGSYGFRAHYAGDATYLPSDGPCEPLQVLDANIQISPASATNPVGTNHVLTITVNALGGVIGGGSHTATASIVSGPGSFVGSPSCSYTGGAASASCTVTISSASVGTTVVSATSDVPVGGVTFTRTTGTAVNTAAGGSGNASKAWVDANIQIAPPTDNNPVSTNHVLTITVNAINGTLGNGTATASIVSGPGSFVGSPSCSYTGGAASASCTVSISSATTGATVVSATSVISVGGVSVTRTTGTAANTASGGSGNAAKNWGDDTVRTDILNASGGVVTSVVAGTVVHDKVFVQRTAGTPASVPNPTGNVIFHRYTTADCTGTATDQTVALTPGDPSTAVSADFAPTGNMSYKADYLGDANYPARSGACEPLTVTPVPAPAIAIVKNPKGQTVPQGGTARFQITVTNVGNTVLTNVTVTDPQSPNCNRTQAQIPALASMAPNASVTYSCSRPNVQAAYDNVATATGTPPTGPNVTASDTAPVKVTKLTPPKKHPKVVSHKRPKATG
jgi:hypothetical protein